MHRRLMLQFAAAAISAALLPTPAAAAPGIEETFRQHTPGSTVTVDHSDWTKLLDTYVVSGTDGLNRVRYKEWKAEARPQLTAYIARLEATNVAALDRPEQFAFWANLYNARTINVVLDRYPVRSIKDITLGGTLLANVTGGPWKAKIAKVAGHSLALDDIEHVILRGIFKDPRVHFAVNCASVGCPNLAREAFIGARLDAQLDALARAYVNSPRGVRVGADGRVTASGIYNWFQVDFGNSPTGVLEHARRYSDPALKSKLEGITTIAEFNYDWSLNDAAR